MKDTKNAAGPVILAQNLNLLFPTNDRPVQALRNVNLTINKGDLVSFIGPSGCGKTTLLRAIAALKMLIGKSLTVNGITRKIVQRMMIKSVDLTTLWPVVRAGIPASGI